MQYSGVRSEGSNLNCLASVPIEAMQPPAKGIAIKLEGRPTLSPIAIENRGPRRMLATLRVASNEAVQDAEQS